MALQNQVNTTLAVGVPGAKADMNNFDYYPQSLKAEAAITVGTFVGLGTDPEKQADYGFTTPVGFVERNMVYPNYDVTDEGSLAVPVNGTLTIATKGAFWATLAAGTAAPGAAVNTVTASGAVTAAAVASGIVAAAGWTFATAGVAGDTVLIKRS